MANTDTRPTPHLINAPTPLSLPTPSLDPGNIDAIEGYNDETAGYVAPAREAFRLAHEGIASTIAARRAVALNTAWTDDAKLLKVAEHADKKQEAATRAFDSATARLTTGIKSLDESLSKPLEASNPFGPEVRAHVLKMSNEERQTFLDDAVKRKDTRTLSAVLSGPSCLSGLQDTQQQHFIRQYNELTQPAVTQRLAVMKKALDLIETRAGLLFGQIEEAIGGKGARHRVTQARLMQKRAEDALRSA